MGSNPFLLAGSYIGLIVGIILSYFSFAIILDLAEKGKFTTFSLLMPIIPIIIGFLLGWFLHLLFLKMFKMS